MYSQTKPTEEPLFMSDDICLLITMLYNGALSKVAIKTNDQMLRDNYQYWCEPNIKLLLEKELPLHCHLGQIVEVEEIFEICENK